MGTEIIMAHSTIRLFAFCQFQSIDTVDCHQVNVANKVTYKHAVLKLKYTGKCNKGKMEKVVNGCSKAWLTVCGSGLNLNMSRSIIAEIGCSVDKSFSMNCSTK